MMEKKWEHRRFEVAKEVFIYGLEKSYNTVGEIAKWSVEYADALITELRKNENEKTDRRWKNY